MQSLKNFMDFEMEDMNSEAEEEFNEEIEEVDEFNDGEDLV